MAFVVTAGQIEAVERSGDFDGWGDPSSRTVTLSPTLIQTYEQIWRAQPAIRTVTGFLARNVAQLGIDPYRKLSPTDRVKADDHPLARLLERPMGDGSKWTKYRLLNALVHDLCVFDNAYWVKMRLPGGQVCGVQPVPPRLCRPYGKSVFEPEGYRVHGNRGWRDLKPDQVVHFHGYNPEDHRRGVAPIETLRQVLAEEHSATRYREQMWRNGARVAGYLRRPSGAPRWSVEARERFKADWGAQYSGDGPATGGTPILEDGMEFASAAVTPKDAQYVESRKLTREEVAVAYYIPPAMLGLLDGANYGSVQELHKILYQDTLGPTLVQISQDIEAQLLEDLDITSRDGSVYVEFNLKGKLNGSFEEQAKALQSSVGGPWMTRAEARAMHNLPSLDGADELIVPLNVTAGGLASPNDTAPDEPNNEASNGKAAEVAELLRATFMRQLKTVIDGVSAGKRAVGDVFDQTRWNVELASDLARLGVFGPVGDINAKTHADLAAVLAGPGAAGAVTALFGGYIEARAEQLAGNLGAVAA